MISASASFHESPSSLVSRDTPIVFVVDDDISVRESLRTPDASPTNPSDAGKPVVSLIFPKSSREGAGHLDRLQVFRALEA
jgi:hypothetical protein